MKKAAYTQALLDAAAAVRKATDEISAVSAEFNVDDLRAQLAGNLAPDARAALLVTMGAAQEAIAKKFVAVRAAKDALYELAMTGFED